MVWEVLDLGLVGCIRMGMTLFYQNSHECDAIHDVYGDWELYIYNFGVKGVTSRLHQPYIDSLDNISVLKFDDMTHCAPIIFICLLSL